MRERFCHIIKNFIDYMFVKPHKMFDVPIKHHVFKRIVGFEKLKVKGKIYPKLIIKEFYVMFGSWNSYKISTFF